MELQVPTNRTECDALFLNNQMLKVVFVKKNGDSRTMLCTRSAELMPPSKAPAEGGAPKRPPSETSYPVFDLERNDWRAFTIANVVSVEAVQ